MTGRKKENTTKKDLKPIKPNNMYYNTTSLDGIELKEAKNQEMKQKERILEFFKANKKEEFTPFDVHKALFGNATPVTSIRRAITDLTKEGELTQTQTQKREIYGKNNFCWKYNK